MLICSLFFLSVSCSLGDTVLEIMRVSGFQGWRAQLRETQKLILLCLVPACEVEQCSRQYGLRGAVEAQLTGSRVGLPMVDAGALNPTLPKLYLGFRGLGCRV